VFRRSSEGPVQGFFAHFYQAFVEELEQLKMFDLVRLGPTVR
jgi:hypothetical protein